MSEDGAGTQGTLGVIGGARVKLKRGLQIFFVCLFTLVSLSIAVTAIASPRPVAVLPLLGLMMIPLLIGSIPVAVLEVQLRLLRKAGGIIRGNIDAISRELFDEPGAVRPGYDLTVTNPTTGALVSSLDTDMGFTTDGVCRGARVSIASHTSAAGRQLGEFSHTYSHVVVDVLGLDKPFSIRREGAASKVARAIGIGKDATVGDAAFDATFVVDADEELARAVLDDSIRRRLGDLQAQVHRVSSEMGPGGMSVILTKHGLALRWPGDITPQLARFVRDLLLDMREKMLAHEARVAARVDGAVGYRVASDATPAVSAPASDGEQSVDEGADVADDGRHRASPR